MHGAFGEVFGFGFAGEAHTEPFTKNELSELYAIANQFHLVYLGFDGPKELPSVTLSDRQREVLQWVAIGKSRSQISEIMNISEDTVDDHFRHIFRKLVCNDRTVAVLKAIQFGLVRI
jgi:DNA-binding CsgD family transcriptional regulator